MKTLLKLIEKQRAVMKNQTTFIAYDTNELEVEELGRGSLELCIKLCEERYADTDGEACCLIENLETGEQQIYL